MSRILRDTPQEHHTTELYMSLLRAEKQPPYKLMRHDLMTEELYDILLTYDIDVVKDIPQHMLSQERIRKIVDVNPWSLYFIPRHLLTQELCDYVITKDFYTYRIIPSTYKTIENTMIAISLSSYIFEYIPEHLRTFEICKYALERWYYMSNDIKKYVPAHILEQITSHLPIVSMNEAHQS